MMKKNELGQKKVTFKLRGCISALTLAVIHNFKCRNLDFSNKLEFKAPSVSAASRKSGSPIMKVVEGPSPSTRQLVMDLPHSLMTDEEIDALDVIEYVKNMHKLERNALAFCQVNLEIAQNIRQKGKKLSQDSISLDDSEVFNPDFLSQIDDICKRHLEAKDSANKVDPTISLLVKRTVDLEFERNEDVLDLDSGVHGVEEKEGKKSENVLRVKEPGDDYDDESLDEPIDRIASQGVDSDKPKTEEDEKEAGVGFSSMPGLHAVPVNNHGIILCRSLQQYNKYLSDLSPEQRLLVDYLFYNEFEDLSFMSLDIDSEEVKMKNHIMQSELQSDLIVDFDNPHSNYAVQLYKFDLISMPRQGWLTSAVIDGCACMFNRQEEESPSATRRFWFNIMPFVKKVKVDSEIAENEIILKKLEGTSEYDQKLKEWEEKKKKLVIKDDDLYYNKCKEAISSWVKSFPGNDIREAELCRAFDSFIHNVPAGTHLLEVAATGYFFSPVRVDVSARNPGKVQAALTETRRGLAELSLEPLREEDYYEVPVGVSARNPGKVQAALTETRRGLAELSLEPLREEDYYEVPVGVSARNPGKVQAALTETRRGLAELSLEPLREEDYYEVPVGVSARNPGKVQAALTETRRGLAELSLEPLREEDYYEAATKNLERCRLALRLVEHPLNKLREKVKHDCYVWSANKPQLMARQKLRKDKEAVLDKLAFNRSKRTNRKEAHVLQRRREHEAKVEEVLNNKFEDKVKLEQLLKFRYS
ncbi:hypothetical protein BVRB_1g013120 [Beta vulgaris subsp. vulgaris]|nr:hypothetical protein BVRB_1g013120 [Beta vulgaris subsp. vulgaris]